LGWWVFLVEHLLDEGSTAFRCSWHD
jgi:hypothetical protein